MNLITVTILLLLILELQTFVNLLSLSNKTNVPRTVSDKYHDLLQYINYEEEAEEGKSLNDLRLNDGKPVPEEMNSYIVLLCIYLNTTWARCSGSLISENFILTAGHCTNSDGSNVIVAHGKENLQEYVNKRSKRPINEFVGHEFNVEERKIKKVFFYPNQTRKKYDLALMKLESPFKVNVSFLDVATKKVHILKNCMSIGYGISEIPKQQLTLGYIVNEPLTLTAPSFKLKDERFCIIRSKRLPSICPGDSGSPLICDKKVWGVTAYGDETNCKNNLLFCYYPLFRAKKWLNRYIEVQNAAAVERYQRVKLFHKNTPGGDKVGETFVMQQPKCGALKPII